MKKKGISTSFWNAFSKRFPKFALRLDSIQKHKPITDDAIKILRDKKLIEGRKLNYIISLDIARKTHQISLYTQQRGLSSIKYSNMVLEFLNNIGKKGANRMEIIDYLGESLPQNKDATAKKKFVTNLLSKLKKDNKIFNIGMTWKLKEFLNE